MKQAKSSGYLKGAALGILIGLLLSTITLWLISDSRSAVTDNIADHLTYLFTLIAAGLALWGVSNQIQNAVDLDEARRAARLDASLSSLPIVLSNLVQMAEVRYHAVARGDLDGPEDQVDWVITDFELSTLRECIEYSTGREKYLLQQVIRIYQVLVARWRGAEGWVDLFSTPPVDSSDPALADRLEQFYMLRNWIIFRSHCNALFDFSRGERTTQSNADMKSSVLFFLRHITDGGPKSEGGWSLRNNANYDDFVTRQEQLDRMTFIDDDWRN